MARCRGYEGSAVCRRIISWTRRVRCHKCEKEQGKIFNARKMENLKAWLNESRVPEGEVLEGHGMRGAMKVVEAMLRAE